MEPTTHASELTEVVAGGLAGGTSRLFAAPFDLLKIRFQIDNKDALGRVRYSSLGSAVSAIYAEEGLIGFWRGNLAATWLWVVYAAVQFLVYSEAKASITCMPPGSFLVSLCSGAVAGAVATTATYPLDFVRTAFASQGMPKTYATNRILVQRTLQERGPGAFFQGLSPSLLQICPYIAMNFAFYELFRSTPVQSMGMFESQRIPAGWCGFLSGGIAKAVVYPLDTIKKRMQVQQGMRHPEYNRLPTYSGWIDCLSTIIRDEGVTSLYRGITPSLLKTAPATGITFAVHEVVRDELTSIFSQATE